MCKFNMFITAVCVLFLIKLRWPKNKSIYDTNLHLNLLVYDRNIFFDRLRQCLKNVRKGSENVQKGSSDFRDKLENLRKSLESGRKSSENRQKRNTLARRYEYNM